MSIGALQTYGQTEVGVPERSRTIVSDRLQPNIMRVMGISLRSNVFTLPPYALRNCRDELQVKL